MRLVASSEPGAVNAWEAKHLIEQRLVLATSVCRELEASGGNYGQNLPEIALSFLRQWVGAHYPHDKGEVHASDGLKAMVVPAGAGELMRELEIATGVCEALALLWTADMRSEFEHDSKKITELLEWWRELRLDIHGPPTQLT